MHDLEYEFSKPLTISHLIFTAAKHLPTASSIIAPAYPALTYRGLWEQVCAVGQQLNALGIGRQDCVALVLPNGPFMATAFLSIVASTICAPLNPAYRADEFAYYLADLNAKAVVVQGGLDSPARAVAQALGIPTVELMPSTEAAGLFRLIAENNVGVCAGGFTHPDDTALLLHTSGTTARPKLVPLTQHNLCTSAQQIQTHLQLTRADRCLNVMPLFHIHGLVGALLASLAAGGSIICTSGFAAPQFFTWLSEFQPTWYTAVPTMHQAILAYAHANRDTLQYDFAAHQLRLIRSSSASLPSPIMQALEQLFHAPVIEAYGMTEASHQMSSNPLPPGQRKPGSVGRPAGAQMAVMAQDGPTLLPPGATGEIVIRGASVMGGYVNNPAANQNAFSAGWFRTGDQGYFDDDGYLFLRGRIKELINRGGEKVAPPEVDEVLLAHPDVAQAVTFAMPHPNLGEDVVAAVVLQKQANVTIQELRHFVLDRIAHSKAPSQIIVVDEIPKGPTGKLQRIGLANHLRHKLQAAYLPPRDPVEEILCQIWAELLNRTPVGIADNFFALGGDSLSAGQVVARLRATFAVELPLSVMFTEPVLADQAAIVHQRLLDAVQNLTDEQAQTLLLEV